MRALIVFYSRSGSTKKAVHTLGILLGADLAEIHCSRYHRGATSYLQAAVDSVRGKLPPIETAPQNALDYDQVVIATPIWSGHPALPIRAFLAAAAPLPERVALLVTRGGVSPARTFTEMQARLPHPVVATLALKTRDIWKDRIQNALAAFAAELSKQPGRAKISPAKERRA